MAAHLLRRAALRAFASTSQLTRNQSTLSSSSSLNRSSSISAATKSLSFSPSAFRRTYATDPDIIKEETSASDVPPEAAPQSASEFADEDQRHSDSQGSVAETISDTARNISDKVAAGASAVSQGFSSIQADRPQHQQYNDRDDRRGGGARDNSRTGGRPMGNDNPPSDTLYLGNLYFEITEAILKKEFARFGSITDAKIIMDARGLSKGFGYISFGDQNAATEAREAMDGQVLEGRRLTCQFALKRAGGPRDTRNFAQQLQDGPRNPPSKTLFIGNMSYEMTDKDLNDLFKGIKGVLDVRVAIDRRTGQPRGFAHADFVDTASATAASSFLGQQEFYGRQLRIDYSAQSSSMRSGDRDGGDRGRQ